jgi:hypothetical protein
MSHYRSSRPKPPPPGKEQAKEIINLGEFQDADTLTYSEAALVLNALLAKRRNDRKDVNGTEYDFPSYLASRCRGCARRILPMIIAREETSSLTKTKES